MIDDAVQYTVFGNRPLSEIEFKDLPQFTLENMEEFLHIATPNFPNEINEISAETGKTRREVYEQYFIMSFHRLLGKVREAREDWLEDNHPLVYDDIERIIGL